MMSPGTDQNQHLDMCSCLSYPGKQQLLNQNILHYSATECFLGQLLYSSFQWQRYCCLITGHLRALYIDVSTHASCTSQNCWHSVCTQTYVKKKDTVVV